MEPMRNLSSYTTQGNTKAVLVTLKALQKQISGLDASGPELTLTENPKAFEAVHKAVIELLNYSKTISPIYLNTPAKVMQAYMGAMSVLLDSLEQDDQNSPSETSAVIRKQGAKGSDMFQEKREMLMAISKQCLNLLSKVVKMTGTLGPNEIRWYRRMFSIIKEQLYGTNG